jgi:hypothetical protein
MTDIQTAFVRVEAVAQGRSLPGLEIGTSYGTPALKVRRKLLVRMKDAETLVLACPIEMKALLMQAAPDIYYQTDHYKGWPALLIRLAAITDEELGHRIEAAWLAQAGKSLLKQREAVPRGPGIQA